MILRSKKIVLDLIHHSKERKRERKERERRGYWEPGLQQLIPFSLDIIIVYIYV